jgi:hypothetical protein
MKVEGDLNTHTGTTLPAALWRRGKKVKQDGHLIKKNPQKRFFFYFSF